MNLRGRATAILDHGALILGAAVIAPSVAATAITGNAAWARGAVIAISALIACERSGLAPIGVAAQGMAIVVGIAILLAAKSHPSLMIAAIAAIAGGCFMITAHGTKLRSLAAFTFIPILYVAYEEQEAGAPDGMGAALLHIAPLAVLAIAPVMIVAVARQHRARSGGGYARHMTRIMRWFDHGSKEPATRMVTAVVIGTSMAAGLTTWLHLPHGQWAIWSAASVVSAEAVMRKLHDRVSGALIGVPLGFAAALVLPATPVVTGAAAVAGLLTLIAIRPYRSAFATRCACVALALGASHGSGLAVAERAEDVLLGGMAGLVAFGLIKLAGMWRFPGSSSANRFRPSEPGVPYDAARVSQVSRRSSDRFAEGSSHG